MRAKSNDVSHMGIKHKGRLVRTFMLCATVSRVGKKDWMQGPTRAFVNGKRVPLKDGQEIAAKVYKK